mgnify:FL=1
MTYTNKDLELLWLTSFRYCMGRSTYIVDDFKQTFIKNYDTVPCPVRRIIERELSWEFGKEEQYQNLGHSCDKKAWQDVLNFIREN